MMIDIGWRRWKPLVHSKGAIVHESEPGSDGRLVSMTWKEMFLDLRLEYLCRIPQREAEAQERFSKWFVVVPSLDVSVSTLGHRRNSTPLGS